MVVVRFTWLGRVISEVWSFSSIENNDGWIYTPLRENILPCLDVRIDPVFDEDREASLLSGK